MAKNAEGLTVRHATKQVSGNVAWMRPNPSPGIGVPVRQLELHATALCAQVSGAHRDDLCPKPATARSTIISIKTPRPGGVGNHGRERMSTLPRSVTSSGASICGPYRPSSDYHRHSIVRGLSSRIPSIMDPPPPDLPPTPFQIERSA